MQALTYVLLLLGIVGFVGSLVVHLKQQSQSYAERRKMPGNPIVQLLILAVVIIWGLYQLFAPGEAQSSAVVFMEWFAVVGASLGVIGACTGLSPASSWAQRRKSYDR
jgi:hypothetical protein